MDRDMMYVPRRIRRRSRHLPVIAHEERALAYRVQAREQNYSCYYRGYLGAIPLGNGSGQDK